MTLVDANLLLYCLNSSSPEHPAAKKWWDRLLSGTDAVALCWPVLNAVLRIGTNPRVFARPLSITEASDSVQSWLNRPNVRLIHPTDGHWVLFRDLLESTKATGNLVSDAHLAALAIGHACKLASTDSDFSRFAKLKWFNPLASTQPRRN